MAKVAIFDDLQEMIAILAPPLVGQGHEVFTDVSPIDFERVLEFGPEVITLDLYRDPQAFDRPISNIETDVQGFKPLVEMEKYPAINVIPIILIGNCLQEKDVPTSVNYDIFLSFPQDIKLYFPKVVELATMVKTRRRISEFVCPKCGSRLTFTKTPAVDLFCPRCHSSVAIIPGNGCIARDADGKSIPCTMDLLKRPVALPLKIE